MAQKYKNILFPGATDSVVLNARWVSVVVLVVVVFFPDGVLCVALAVLELSL